MPKETRDRSPEEGDVPDAVKGTANGATTSAPSEPKNTTGEKSIAVVREERRRRQERALARQKASSPVVSAGGSSVPPIIPATTSLTPFPPTGQRPGNPRRLRTTFRSAIIFVGIPTLLAILYFGVIASDQFASRADFIIKTRSTGVPSSVGGGASLMGGMPSVSPMTIVDMLVVKEYVESAQVLEDISPVINVRKLFSTQEADPFARLRERVDFRKVLTGKVWSEGLFATVTEEDLLKYWKKMVVVNFDMTTGISTLEVKAFSAQDSKKLADAVLGLSEKLVNRLSERSQFDTLEFARKEVEDANKRAIESLDGLEKFQENATQLDPEGYAKVRGEIQGKLEATLSDYNAQLSTLRRSLPDDAPGIQAIKDQIAGLQKQLAEHKKGSTTSEIQTQKSAGEMLNEFSKLKLKSDFATQAYMSALNSLEMARRDATQQSRYLEAFVRPQVPQKADYPKRLQSVAIVFLASAAIWAIGGLLIAAAKEHL